MRPSSSFNGMPERQFFTFDNPAARLVIDLNIEAPNGFDNFAPNVMEEQGVVTDSPDQCFGCGKKKRNITAESEDIDLNEIPIDVDDDDEEEEEEEDEEYCTCGNPTPPIMIGIEGTNTHLLLSSSHVGVVNGNHHQQGQSSSATTAAAIGGGSGIGGGSTETGSGSGSGSGTRRSRRAMMRGNPRRVVTSSSSSSSVVDEASGSGSSSSTTSTEIPSNEEEPPTFVSVFLPPPAGATGFRIRDLISRNNNNNNNDYYSLRSYGSGVEVHRHSTPDTTTRGVGSSGGGSGGSYALSLGQTSQPSINIQPPPPPGSVMIMERAHGSNFGNNGLNIQNQADHQVGPMQLIMAASSSGTNNINGETRLNFPATIENFVLPRATRVNFDAYRHNLQQTILMQQAGQRRGVENGDYVAGVDDMTYEERYELGMRIGSVNTLSEEVIEQSLRRRYYRPPLNRPPPQEAESCCICLVDFVNRDVLGRINCAHTFHFDCIKQWLREKNFCPLCKQTALVLPN